MRRFSIAYVLQCHVNSGNHIFEFVWGSVVVILDIWTLFDLLIPTKYFTLNDHRGMCSPVSSLEPKWYIQDASDRLLEVY